MCRRDHKMQIANSNWMPSCAGNFCRIVNYEENGKRMLAHCCPNRFVFLKEDPMCLGRHPAVMSLSHCSQPYSLSPKGSGVRQAEPLVSSLSLLTLII